MSFVFNGRAFAKEKEERLIHDVRSLMGHGKILHVKTFVFTEDKGSVLYTGLKKAAADRLGIVYEPVEHSLTEDTSAILKEIRKAGKDAAITGVMIQKPAKSVFASHMPATNFQSWWEQLTEAIEPSKDVDCLTAINLARIESGEEKCMLPATVQAVVFILAQAKVELHITDHEWKQKKVAILGRSDIVGKPASWVLRKHHAQVDMFGKSDMPEDLFSYDIVVSAVGSPNVVKGNMVKENTILIDVGAPTADIEFETVRDRAAFITPVPGGVGPVTVISLMESVVTII